MILVGFFLGHVSMIVLALLAGDHWKRNPSKDPDYIRGYREGRAAAFAEMENGPLPDEAVPPSVLAWARKP